MMLNMTFKCPLCGGSKFGSMILGRDPNGPMVRHCHGRNGPLGCEFSWPEAEDWRYMIVDGAKLDVHEFEAVMARVRRTPVAVTPIGKVDLPGI
jgi:hypothetical protein